MAIAIDGSTPARWAGIVSTTSGGTITSASFTAPADALLVLCATYDTNGVWSAGTRTASDTGTLSWSPQVERLGNETTAGGASGLWTARTTSSVSRTVSFALGTGTGSGTPWATGRVSCKLYVLTGVDVDGTPVDTVGANNEGGSTTDSITTSNITAGAAGLLLAADCDWNAQGVLTSSDLTVDSAHYASEISVMSGYKSVSAGTVNGNLNSGGASPQHKWCQITVREAAGAAASLLPRTRVQSVAVRHAGYY